VSVAAYMRRAALLSATTYECPTCEKIRTVLNKKSGTS
jgi:hypothetical protein